MKKIDYLLCTTYFYPILLWSFSIVGIIILSFNTFTSFVHPILFVYFVCLYQFITKFPIGQRDETQQRLKEASLFLIQALSYWLVLVFLFPSSLEDFTGSLVVDVAYMIFVGYLYRHEPEHEIVDMIHATLFSIPYRDPQQREPMSFFIQMTLFIAVYYAMCLNNRRYVIHTSSWIIKTGCWPFSIVLFGYEAYRIYSKNQVMDETVKIIEDPPEANVSKNIPPPIVIVPPVPPKETKQMPVPPNETKQLPVPPKETKQLPIPKETKQKKPFIPEKLSL